MKKNILSLLFGAVMFAMTAFTGLGDNLTVDSWLNVSSLFGGTARVSIDGSDFSSVNAGQLRATPTSGSSWLTYCTDIGAHLSSGQFTPIPILVAQGMPSWQTPDWAPGGLERAVRVYFTLHDQVHNNADAVALQVLVWESLYDESPSLSSGRFRASTHGMTEGAYGQVTSWIHSPAELAAVGDAAIWWGPSTVAGDYRLAQGLIGDVAVVPEASAGKVLLGVFPILGLAYWRRKIKGS